MLNIYFVLRIKAAQCTWQFGSDNFMFIKRVEDLPGVELLNKYSIHLIPLDKSGCYQGAVNFLICSIFSYLCSRGHRYIVCAFSI